MACTTHAPALGDSGTWKAGPAGLRYKGLLREQPKPAGVKSADWRRACRLADGVTRVRNPPAGADVERAPPSKTSAAAMDTTWPRVIKWPASWADAEDEDSDCEKNDAQIDAAVSPRIRAIAIPTGAPTQSEEAGAAESPTICVPTQRRPFESTAEAPVLTRTQKRRQRRTRVAARGRDGAQPATEDSSVCGRDDTSDKAVAAQYAAAALVSAARFSYGADGAPVVTTPEQALLARLAPKMWQPATPAQAQWLNDAARNPTYAPYVECELLTAVPPAGLTLWYSLPEELHVADEPANTVAVRLLPPVWSAEQLCASSEVLKQRYDVMARLPPSRAGGSVPCQSRLVLRWGVPFWQLAGVAQQRAHVAVDGAAA